MALLLKEITTERISKQQFTKYLKNELLPCEEHAWCRQQAQEIFAMFGPHFCVHVACVLTHGVQIERFGIVHKALKRVYFKHNLDHLNVYRLDTRHIELIRKELQICAAGFETKTKQRKEMPAKQVA